LPLCCFCIFHVRPRAVAPFINYQGKITDSEGADINDTGAAGFTFRLYNQETDGTLLWEETHANVTIDRGIFNIILGINSPLPAGSEFDGDGFWLEVELNSVVMSSRQQFTSGAGRGGDPLR
jgi:hypothetical protein